MAENYQIAWVIDELGKMPWAVSSLSAFKASSPPVQVSPCLITPAVRPQTLQSVNKLNSSQNVIDNKSISVHSSRFVPLYSHFKHIHTHVTFHPALNFRTLLVNTLIIQTVCSRKVINETTNKINFEVLNYCKWIEFVANDKYCFTVVQLLSSIQNVPMQPAYDHLFLTFDHLPYHWFT